MKRHQLSCQRVVLLLIIFVVMPTIGTVQNTQVVNAENRPFYPYDSGIVYMLPSDASTPNWMRVYGDRTAFYVYANLSLYKNGILRDLDVISRYYRFIVRILPLDDSAFFYYNLRLMDSWAAEKNLKVVYTFFPKSKYGPEDSYLIAGTTVHERLIHDMQFVGNLSSTTAVAVWYGWKGVQFNVQEIRDFYYSLPKDLKGLYCVWLDGSFVRDAVAAGLQRLVDPLNITVVTELYSVDILSQYGFAFKRQIIVSGSSGVYSIDQWQTTMQRKLNNVRASTGSMAANQSPRKLIVWIFWDRNDGSGEQYTAYLNGALSNPLLASVPALVYLDRANATSMRANVRSIITFRYHFSWPDGFNTTDVVVSVNGTEYRTDANGWITFTASSDKVVKLVFIPENVKWGSYELKVAAHTQIPQVIFDKVLIELSAHPNPAEVGTNTTILAQGFYEFDGTAFRGNIALNRTLENTKPGIYCITATKIVDPLYGLTTFDSNVLTVTVYNKPVLVAADHTYLIELLSVLLAAGACFGVWLARKRFSLTRRSIG